MFSTLGRRMTSFIFGAQQTASDETMVSTAGLDLLTFRNSVYRSTCTLNHMQLMHETMMMMMMMHDNMLLFLRFRQCAKFSSVTSRENAQGSYLLELFNFY